LLGAGEALASYLVADDAAYVWVITQQAAVLRRLDTDRNRLERLVRTLRRALEPAGDPAATLRTPFPVEAARALYRALLAPVQGSLANVRHLIVVPDGPLQSLPFGVLVTDDSGAGRNNDLAQAAWLIKRYAISVLPAETSLRALRAFAKGRPGRDAFGGFGDPLLEGPPGQRGAFSAALRSRGSVADVREVRKLARLPDTADELQAIAASLKARPDAVFLREKATETRVKAADLRSYRTLAFATHGLLAGELQGLAEPALVLTPPVQGDSSDDGLLTASEIAQLRLNADWVILSACNTAADDGTPGAEGLSGLAKAFFYAGARSLLVSHWAVSSDATVRLTTGMLRHHVAGRSKAEALQRSMLDLMQRKGKLPYAHPMFWAPFVVVGEGNPAWRATVTR
jgi:CHAT domain-containing protein